MNTEHLLSVLQNQFTPGLYRLNMVITAEELLSLCKQLGWQGFYIDGANLSNKEDFLSAWAKALDFPDYFGNNWDAFDDCLLDLSWCDSKPRLIIYTQPEVLANQNPNTWEVVQDVFTMAVNYWQKKKTPLSIILLTHDPRFSDIISLEG